MNISFMTGIAAVKAGTSIAINKRFGESGFSDLTSKQEICLEMYLSGMTDLDEISVKAGLSHNGTYAILVLLEKKGLIDYKRFLKSNRKKNFINNKAKCLILIKAGIICTSELARSLGVSRSPIYRYLKELCEEGNIVYCQRGKNKTSIIKCIERT